MPSEGNQIIAETWLRSLRKIYGERGEDAVVEFTLGWRESGKPPVDIRELNIKELKDA